MVETSRASKTDSKQIQKSSRISTLLNKNLIKNQILTALDTEKIYCQCTGF